MLFVMYIIRLIGVGSIEASSMVEKGKRVDVLIKTPIALE